MARKSNFFEELYGQLNEAQQRAVDTIDGPVLVVAGPGTGKTQVLTMRIANILKKTDTPSSAILALTFTDSGVKAMRERLLSIIGPEAYYAGIYTFHSFCSDVIRNNPEKFLLSEDLEPLSDLERIQIFREIIDENQFEAVKPFGNKYFYVKALIKTIQDLKREGISPEELLKIGRESGLEKKDIEKLAETAAAYEIYQKKVGERGRYDFEDMINLVTERFETDPDLLRSYQERYLYILVDEYQDTNSPQNKVATLLASYWGEEANIFAVGDDAQSIYRFQGASVENLLYFKTVFPKAVVITLTENYRNQKTIIEASEDVISNNTLFIENVAKTQRPANDFPNDKVKVGHFSSGITEAFFVSHKIKELIDSKVAPSEIAVIYRNNVDSKDFSDLLSKTGIPFNLVGGENVLEDFDINKLLKLFEVILKVRNKGEDLDLFTVLNYEFLDFDYVDVLKLSRFASEKKINFVEAISHSDFMASKVKNPKAFFDFLKKIHKWQELDSNLTFISFFERVLSESGFLNWILRSEGSIEKLNRLNSLFAEIKRLNIADHTLNLSKFMEDIKVLKDSNIPINEEDLNIRNDAVLLTTAHRSKGLEFEYVFIVKCFDGKWGNNKGRDLIKLPKGLVRSDLGLPVVGQTSRQGLALAEGQALPEGQAPGQGLDLRARNEDERRLFYVSMTRAKKGVFITYADSYFTESSKKEAVPSMFISEIGEERKEELNIAKYESSVKEILKDILKPPHPVTPSLEERGFLKEVLRGFSLSVTSLNTYLECPYKFKLSNLLRTPRAKDKYLALGTAVHASLESYFRKFRDEGEPPEVEHLIEVFNDALSKEVLTPSDMFESRRKGSLMLKAYHSFYKDDFVKPLYTEKFFGYGYSKVFLDGIPLNGKVDKIEYVEQGSRQVRVVDYKTGKVKTRNEIEGKTKYSDGGYKRQLTFYKLLADLDRAFGYKVKEATLDFVEPDKKGSFVKESFEITEDEVSELKSIIKEVMAKIRNLEFPRTTDYRVCANCEYRAHCWPDGIPGKTQHELDL